MSSSIALLSGNNGKSVAADTSRLTSRVYDAHSPADICSALDALAAHLRAVPTARARMGKSAAIDLGISKKSAEPALWTKQCALRFAAVLAGMYCSTGQGDLGFGICDQLSQFFVCPDVSQPSRSLQMCPCVTVSCMLRKCLQLTHRASLRCHLEMGSQQLPRMDRRFRLRRRLAHSQQPAVYRRGTRGFRGLLPWLICSIRAAAVSSCCSGPRLRLSSFRLSSLRP